LIYIGSNNISISINSSYPDGSLPPDILNSRVINPSSAEMTAALGSLTRVVADYIRDVGRLGRLAELGREDIPEAHSIISSIIPHCFRILPLFIDLLVLNVIWMSWYLCGDIRPTSVSC